MYKRSESAAYKKYNRYMISSNYKVHSSMSMSFGLNGLTFVVGDNGSGKSSFLASIASHYEQKAVYEVSLDFIKKYKLSITRKPSSGQIQKFRLLKLLVINTNTLLLDEPETHLSVTFQNFFMLLTSNLATFGARALIASHFIHYHERACYMCTVET